VETAWHLAPLHRRSLQDIALQGMRTAQTIRGPSHSSVSNSGMSCSADGRVPAMLTGQQLQGYGLTEAKPTSKSLQELGAAQPVGIVGQTISHSLAAGATCSRAPKHGMVGGSGGCTYLQVHGCCLCDSCAEKTAAVMATAEAVGAPSLQIGLKQRINGKVGRTGVRKMGASREASWREHACRNCYTEQKGSPP
jgi:hypothetical protein